MIIEASFSDLLLTARHDTVCAYVHVAWDVAFISFRINEVPLSLSIYLVNKPEKY